VDGIDLDVQSTRGCAGALAISLDAATSRYGWYVSALDLTPL